jgi:hypothetical protein
MFSDNTLVFYVLDSPKTPKEEPKIHFIESSYKKTWYYGKTIHRDDDLQAVDLKSVE